MVDLEIAPGWHIYGTPLPEGEGLTPTSIKFDSDLLAQQTLDLPKPTPLRFEALNQTYPVYTGSFKALGTIVLNQKIKPGDYSISGTLNFQQCNDAMCKMPQAVHFELPIKIEPPAPAAPKPKRAGYQPEHSLIENNERGAPRLVIHRAPRSMRQGWYSLRSRTDQVCPQRLRRSRSLLSADQIFSIL